MRYSRTGIVAVLLAAEVFIAGAIWMFLGGHGVYAQAAGLHTENSSGRSFSAINAGNTPHVIVNDPDSRIYVTASNDGLVHVTDQSYARGLVWGSTTRAQLRVERTGEGVAVTRAANSGSSFSIFGVDSEHVDIAVPQGAYVDIRSSDGADVTGIRAPRLAIHSNDGSLRLNDIRVDEIEAVTGDGSIRADIAASAGVLKSGDGSIRLLLDAQNVVINAHTGDGSLRFNGARVPDDNGSRGTFRVGSGGRSLEVATQDGSIRINTKGAQ